jgi:RNA polymerase sigma-70 factor (ECF subfamily)
MPGPDLLTAARAGDQDAFAQLVAPLERELHQHAYRMLGSLDDADDALQDALLRAWRGIGTYEGRASLRAWLHRVTANASLDLAKKRPARVLPTGDDGMPDEIAWLDPYPAGAGPRDVDEEIDAPHTRYARRETLELAFVAALQHLPEQQRAVLVLREVLHFSAKETAEVLDTSVAAVNSALQRARAGIEARRPAISQTQALAQLGDEATADLVRRYAAALESGDVEEVIALLGGSMRWSMPPNLEVYEGEPATREFLLSGPLMFEWRHVPVWSNGQAAVGCYIREALSDDPFRFWVLDVLRIEDGRVVEVTAFINRSLAAAYGLPDALPADAPPTSRDGLAPAPPRRPGRPVPWQDAG